MKMTDFRGQVVDHTITYQQFVDLYSPRTCKYTHTFSTFGFLLGNVNPGITENSVIGFRTKDDAEKYVCYMLGTFNVPVIESDRIDIKPVPGWTEADYIKHANEGVGRKSQPSRHRSNWPSIIGFLIGLHVVLTWRPIWGWIDRVGQRAIDTFHDPRVVGSIIVIILVMTIVRIITAPFRRKKEDK